MSNYRNRYTVAVVFLLVALCVMLAGCSNSEEPPPSYKPPAFTSDSVVVVYRVPDAVPFYYDGNFPEDFESMLEVYWCFPTPYYNGSEAT